MGRTFVLESGQGDWDIPHHNEIDEDEQHKKEFKYLGDGTDIMKQFDNEHFDIIEGLEDCEETLVDDFPTNPQEGSEREKYHDEEIVDKERTTWRAIQSMFLQNRYLFCCCKSLMIVGGIGLLLVIVSITLLGAMKLVDSQQEYQQQREGDDSNNNNSSPPTPEDSSSSISHPCFQTRQNLRQALKSMTHAGMETPYGRLNEWCFNVTNFSHLLQDIHPDVWVHGIVQWDVSRVTDMSYLFQNQYHFQADLSAWDVSSVTDMEHMFENARSFNNDISQWNVAKVTSMEFMFDGAIQLDQDFSAWDTSSVTSMAKLFANTKAFRGQGLSEWKVDKVVHMGGMFQNAVGITTMDLSSWDVSNVHVMERMFHQAAHFQGDVSTWKPSKTYTMKRMFSDTFLFDQDLSNWDVSSVVTMDKMFFKAHSFNQNLCAWQNTLSNHVEVVHFDQAFYDTKCPAASTPTKLPQGPFCHICS